MKELAGRRHLTAAYSRTPSEPSWWVQALLTANPMSGLIASFRAALFNEPIPWHLLWPAAIVVLVVFALGCVYFRRVEDNFVDII